MTRVAEFPVFLSQMCAHFQNSVGPRHRCFKYNSKPLPSGLTNRRPSRMQVDFASILRALRGTIRGFFSLTSHSQILLSRPTRSPSGSFRDMCNDLRKEDGRSRRVLASNAAAAGRWLVSFLYFLAILLRPQN
ncbi:hypothetical protein DENSPDRAFT_633229 [Dentipellis sp. KUC8613]|nr:hypothetical protein DENSPDRAFT_633229 [Dentipellis sp. KUC8613]